MANLGRLGMCLRKHSPEILVIAGIAGGVFSAIYACKQTPKAVRIVEEHKEVISTLHEIEKRLEDKETVKIEEENQDGELQVVEYTPEICQQKMKGLYLSTSLKLVKTFAAPAIIGGLSIASILTGHGIARKRCVALGTAYTALDAAFQTYRQRVVKKEGEEADKDYLVGATDQVVTEYTDEESGEIVKMVERVVPGKTEHTLYIDERSGLWERNTLLTSYSVGTQLRYLNNTLMRRVDKEHNRPGYITLAEIVEALDARKSLEEDTPFDMGNCHMMGITMTVEELAQFNGDGDGKIGVQDITEIILPDDNGGQRKALAVTPKIKYIYDELNWKK